MGLVGLRLASLAVASRGYGVFASGCQGGCFFLTLPLVLGLCGFWLTKISKKGSEPPLKENY